MSRQRVPRSGLEGIYRPTCATPQNPSLWVIEGSVCVSGAVTRPRQHDVSVGEHACHAHLDVARHGRVDPETGEVLTRLTLPEETEVSGLESDQHDLFYA